MKALNLKAIVIAGCATLVVNMTNAEGIPAAADSDVVAYWPFGALGFADASGHGNTLVGGSAVEMGDGFVRMAGTSTGDAEASMKTSSALALGDLPALTVEFWIRWRSSALTSQTPFIEVSENYGNHDGAISIHQGTKFMYAWEKLTPKNAGRFTAENPFGTQVQSWHHVAVVYPKGPYADFRIYIDGKDNTRNDATYNANPDVDFYNDVLYIGGRAGLGKFDGDLAKLRLVGRRLTAAEVAARFESSYPYASNGFCVVTSPRQFSCSTLDPACGNGVHNLSIGEDFQFSAGAGQGEMGQSIVGWNVQTNAFVDGEYAWLPYRSGHGRQGTVPYPGVAMRVEWLSCCQCSADSATFIYGPGELPQGTLVLSVGTVSNRLHTVWKQRVDSAGGRVAMTGLDNNTPHYYAKVQVKTGATVRYERDFEFELPDGANAAYWPFGIHRLLDASHSPETGCALAAGSEVRIGEYATFDGNTDENGMSSTSKLSLSPLNALTVDYWVRPHADEPSARALLIEVAQNYNEHSGAICVQQGFSDRIAAMENVVARASWAGVYSAENPFGSEATRRWHHVVAVYPRGNYEDMRLYVDGVLNSECPYPEHANSTAGVPFYDDILYLGGRVGARKHRLDIDDVRFTGVRRTADEISEIYASGNFARTGEANSLLLAKGHVLVRTTQDAIDYGFYPKLGASAGHSAGEMVTLKAPAVLLNDDGSTNALVVIGATVSTNAPGTATWLPWKKSDTAECSFAYPEGDSAVRVDWTVGKPRRGFALILK